MTILTFFSFTSKANEKRQFSLEETVVLTFFILSFIVVHLILFTTYLLHY